MAKGNKRCSLPLYDSQDGDDPDLELCNFFAPLADLPTSPSPLLKGGCAEGKRKVFSKKRRSPCSNSSSRTVSPSDKRPRVCTSSPEGSVAVTPRAPAPPAGLHLSPGLGPTGHGTAPLDLLSSTTDADANPGSPGSDVHQLPPKLATHSSSTVSSSLEILIVGDSVLRHLTLPGAITYCLSSAKVVDLIKLIPSLIDWHPTVKMVLMHVGTNDVMARNSS